MCQKRQYNACRCSNQVGTNWNKNARWLKTYCKIGVSLFTIAADSQRIILVILLQELLRCVVGVDVDLGQSIVNCLLLVARSESVFQERQQELEAVSRLDLRNELIDGYRSGVDRGEQILDNGFVAVHIKKTANDCRCASWVYSLNVDLDRLELLVLVEVEDQVVDEVEAIAYNDQWQLLGQFGLLQEVLDFFSIVEVFLGRRMSVYHVDQVGVRYLLLSRQIRSTSVNCPIFVAASMYLKFTSWSSLRLTMLPR